MDGFSPLTIESKPIIDKYFAQSSRINSEKSFTTLFLWLDCEYAVIDDCLCIYSPDREGKPIFHLPTGAGDRQAAAKKLLSLAPGASFLPVFSSDISWISRMAGAEVEFIPRRNYFDYVYRRQDLATLAGKKLHQKRNHVNRFMKDYDGRWSLCPMTEENIGDCREAMMRILDTQDGDTADERAAMEKLYDNFAALSLTGAVLYVDGEIAAQTIGERISDTTMLIHIEKADRKFEGAYAAINKLFCERIVPDGVKYINREEDMGIDGLRQAKTSYKPAFLLEKYKAVFGGK